MDQPFTIDRTAFQVITEREAAAMLGVSPMTLRRMRAGGMGPQAVRLSTRRIGYRLATLQAWLAAREGQATVALCDRARAA